MTNKEHTWPPQVDIEQTRTQIVGYRVLPTDLASKADGRTIEITLGGNGIIVDFRKLGRQSKEITDKSHG